jgi:hypothetical protein
MMEKTLIYTEYSEFNCYRYKLYLLLPSFMFQNAQDLKTCEQCVHVCSLLIDKGFYKA